MSTINVTNLSGRGGATPNLPDGANITGVATATTFSGTLDGSLKTTGTPTLGLGVTINASGVAISGVCTAGIVSATTFYGSGSGLTGVGESIGPWYYNPTVNDTLVPVETGIGITFNKLVNMGSGTATLKIVNAGVAGTTIQSWGISSVTQAAVTEITLGSLVSNLIINQTYQVDIPEGFVVSSTGTNYAGTAYTFSTEGTENKLWIVGRGIYGQNLQGGETNISSPTQVPSAIPWKAGWNKGELDDSYSNAAIKTDGTLWMWGNNGYGVIGAGTANNLRYSSPVQLPGTTWSTISISNSVACATKTDGTLWAWGYNETGALGQNNQNEASSPVQVGSDTTWASTANSGDFLLATKTNGTLWAWGEGNTGRLGVNSQVKYSSPVQIPGTTWSKVAVNNNSSYATRTDGTLWSWGANEKGQLGHNSVVKYSSPVQIPGTSWALIAGGYRTLFATRTDGTLWSWGIGDNGGLGHNTPEATEYSSPTQIPGTTWGTSNTSHLLGVFNGGAAIKTDGTLWTWGRNQYGALGQNSPVSSARSSPTQVGSNTDWDQVGTFGNTSLMFIQADQTP